jgi:hypothetical protein
MSYSTSTLTAEQLSLFLATNGLGVDRASGKLLTPGGQEVGVVADAGGVFRLTLFEEEYTIYGTVVKAWWPGFRTAWIIVGARKPDEIGPTLGPHEVICDFCNATIVTRPVPVVDTNALCPECFERTGLRFPGRVSPYTPEALQLCVEP